MSGRDEKGKFIQGNKESVGNNGGVETKYETRYNKLAYNYCLLGATDKNLAEFFDVSEATINNWKREHPEFLESLRAGKENADMLVANSLFQNCLGATVKTQKEVKVKCVDPDTLKIVERIEIIDLLEQLAPDTNAQKFWLSNRRSDVWRNKQEHDHTTQGDKINVISLGAGIKPDESTD